MKSKGGILKQDFYNVILCRSTVPEIIISGRILPYKTQIKRELIKMTQNVEELLNVLADMESQLDYLKLKKQELIDGVLTPEIKQELADIEEEFTPDFERVRENIKALEDKIKNKVLEQGETAKGEFKMAVYNKGRVSWDTKGIEAYAKAIDERLLKFRNEGDPYVTLRKR